LFTQPNTDGVPLLETSQADLAAKYGIEEFDYPTPSSAIRHIGFAPKTQEWYGWSHRAIAGFKVGDVVKKGDVIAAGEAADLRDDAPGPFPVGFKAKTLADAKRMAAQFAIEVS
jgi:hypothetical protein